jgi:hypothetical protein
MDIDIDFPSNFNLQRIVPQAIAASMVKSGELVKHPCGYYMQDVPVDPVTNLAAIPYEEAEAVGYFKIDFLHLSVLDTFSSKQEIRMLLKREPDWNLLQEESVVSKLMHMHKHLDLLRMVKPRTVQALADCMAIIRPSKRRYIQAYLLDPAATRPSIYRNDADDKSALKRSHAIAYALTIVLQLHLVSQGRL